ncbi:hypothetical protein HDA40_004379 [Hamadaea flava]|uniref:DUF1795 domain-containing protein n=1 Tax=Hamadaea flava TaxID=1742688 RepID=A0ABV8LF81_9ACTN|nr:hypothetical protein [Hamadaea flava]MCP2325872.1 hypothetical protein [Hamadaea flava]
MSTAGTRLLRNLASSVAVLVVILFVAWGLPAINRRVPAGASTVGGRAYAVGGGVVVIPPGQAELDLTNTRPGADRGTALFLIGPVRYVIVVAPFTGDLTAAAAKLRAKITGTRGYQVTGAEDSTTTDSGLTGVQGSYTAPGRLGRYAVFLSAGRAIEVTVSGAEPDLANLMTGIEASIASIEQR